MAKSWRDSEDEAVKRTLESDYCPALIQQARDEQDRVLRERLQAGPYKIADIGCGNGYHAAMMAPVCELYHGFEISPAIADTARALWQRESISNAEVYVGDVSQAKLEPSFYDLVFCLYFTPGNLRDRSDDLDRYDDAYLDENPMFIRIVSRFYQAMAPGGSMFLTIYQDVPEAEAAQHDYYLQTGQHVLTPPGSRFVATTEGFWSVRWTKESVLSNLRACGIGGDQVGFTELNEIAWMISVSK